MGNRQQCNPSLRVYIETEKQFYNAGSSIQGVIFVEATDNCRLDALYLRIEGKESCQWFEGSSLNRNKLTGTDTFYIVEYLIEKYEDRHFEKGKYAYPFSIELSENLPGSFHSSVYDAKIEYELSAYFVNFKQTQNTHLCSVPLLVRQPFRQQMASYHGSIATNPVSCGVFAKGEVILQAQFQRNVCFEGESIRIDLLADNSNGHQQLAGLLVRLVQYTFVCANNGSSRTFRKILHQHKISKAVPAGEKKEMHYQMSVSTVEHQTSIGTLVANYYQVEVTADMGLFTSEVPSVYAPLFVLKKSFKVSKPSAKVEDRAFRAYSQSRAVAFRAPEYSFRKNKNLEVMNFKLQDLIEAVAAMTEVIN